MIENSSSHSPKTSKKGVGGNFQMGDMDGQPSLPMGQATTEKRKVPLKSSKKPEAMAGNGVSRGR